MATPPLSRNCDGVSPLSQNTLRLLPLDLGADREDPMKRFQAAAAMATAAAVVTMLGSPAAEAHGLAQGGVASGFLHPLLGLDHLAMLVAAGAAAALINPLLLGWSLAGALVGGWFGALGIALPAAEVLAALAIAATGAVILLWQRQGQGATGRLWLNSCGVVLASGLAVHAMLHGLEAPQGSGIAGWWLGALASSSAVALGAYWSLRRLPAAAIRPLATGLVLVGVALALVPLA